jgi:hypothetical protein
MSYEEERGGESVCLDDCLFLSIEKEYVGKNKVKVYGTGLDRL